MSAASQETLMSTAVAQMPRYVLDLACGHKRPFTYRKKPPFLEPSETSWSLSWCMACNGSQKVLDVRLNDGQACE